MRHRVRYVRLCTLGDVLETSNMQTKLSLCHGFLLNVTGGGDNLRQFHTLVARVCYRACVLLFNTLSHRLDILRLRDRHFVLHLIVVHFHTQEMLTDPSSLMRN